ncbi:Ankyrin repeat family protein [Abeliophyllum distichum]|uniref:Ankyrin repeat family protein n=1 Tax=Abeliophyllum distichum TaxID=126358 RepID=A0ABD1TDE7_9LAMI
MAFFEQNVSSMFVEEEIKKNLFRNAMSGKWDEVIKTYAQRPEAHSAKITRSEDTALHIAISDGQETTVELLMEEIIRAQNSWEVLTIGNELGNMPLHLAASLGNVKMCKLIAGVDSRLIGERNKDNETPFFLAVLHGKSDAFICLHSMCKGEEGYSYCKKKDNGETILHSAIGGEYFDIAFQIIYLYPKLINAVTVDGVTPLHLLASKPSAFKSGSQIRGFRRLIYQFIFVDELEEKSPDHSLSQGLQYDTKAKYPENYQTCVGFVRLLINIYRVLTGHTQKENKGQSDAENPRVQQSSTKEKSHASDPKGQQSDPKQAQGHQLFPPNHLTCFHAIKLVSKSMLVILGLGSRDIVKLREKKEKHIWSVQIMDKLLEHTSTYEYENNGRIPQGIMLQIPDGSTPFPALGNGIPFPRLDPLTKPMSGDDLPPETSSQGDRKNGNKDNGQEMEKGETPILIAAKNGVVEMVQKILELFPVAIHDMNTDKKNIVLLAVENRHPHVYKFLLDKKIMKETIFRKVDVEGNSALHLAAKLGDRRPWLIPGAALQMQWEIKWYEFVKNSMPLHFFVRYNREGKTPRDIFSESHQKLVESGGQWLTSTSESCSVVAALIATVAFATSATFPGGFREESEKPTFENEPAFNIFAISSLVALCFSVTSVVMFLAILTSRYQEKDFSKDLPNRLLVGLTTLFVSIASILISFCSGHFFVLKDKLKYAAFPVYAFTCLPVTFFAMAQFPLYFDLIRATFKKVPQRSYR